MSAARRPARDRHIESAHQGRSASSATPLAPHTLSLKPHASLDHQHQIRLDQRTARQLAMLLFVLAVLLHAWIGVRDVLIDYVHPIAIRAALLGAIGLALVALGLWAAQALILVRLA